MCSELIRTASGQTYWVVMEVAASYLTCPGFSSILLRYQTPAPGWTQTLTREEQCTLGNAGWKMWGGGWGRNTSPISHSLPLSWHKMQALLCRTYWIPGVSKDLSSSPFCFSALQDSWTEQRLLALIWLPAQRQVLKTSTHLCFQPSVWNSAIWWVLDAQARLILWFRQEFFLTNVSKLLYHLPHIDALWEYCITNLY